MFLYEEEIRDLVQKGKLEVHVAFSRDRIGVVHNRQTGMLVEKEMKPRYVDSAILDAGKDFPNLLRRVKKGVWKRTFTFADQLHFMKQSQGHCSSYRLNTTMKQRLC